MATFAEVLSVALEHGSMKIVSVNQNLLEVVTPRNGRPSYLKIQVPDELALDYVLTKNGKPKGTTFLLHADGDILNSIAAEIDARAAIE